VKKTALIVFGIFLLILGLALITNWRFQNWQKNFRGESFFKLESLGLEGLKEIFSPTASESQKFVSPDGKLSVEYPADWLAIEEKEILKNLVPEDWALKYNLETLLLAAKIQREGLAQLIIYKGDFNLTIPEIVNEMAKANQEQSWQVELISSDFQEKEGVFEAGYQDPAGNIIRSREKILAGEENEVYFISAIALEKDWLESSGDIEEIINSVILIP